MMDEEWNSSLLYGWTASADAGFQCMMKDVGGAHTRVCLLLAFGWICPLLIVHVLDDYVCNQDEAYLLLSLKDSVAHPFWYVNAFTFMFCRDREEGSTQYNISSYCSAIKGVKVWFYLRLMYSPPYYFLILLYVRSTKDER